MIFQEIWTSYTRSDNHRLVCDGIKTQAWQSGSKDHLHELYVSVSGILHIRRCASCVEYLPLFEEHSPTRPHMIHGFPIFCNT